MPEELYTTRCVINEDGLYVDFVLVHLVPDENDKTAEYIDSYVLKNGESLIETPPPSNFTNPRWNGIKWEETA